MYLIKYQVLLIVVSVYSSKKTNKKTPNLCFGSLSSINLNHNMHPSVKMKIYFSYCFLICTRRAFWQKNATLNPRIIDSMFEMTGQLLLLALDELYDQTKTDSTENPRAVSLNKFIC